MSVSVAPARLRGTPLAALAMLGGGIALLIGVFWAECRAAVSTWETSTAYGHCFLVIPIALYIVWDQRDRLTGLRPVPTPAFAILALPITAAWFVAERLGIMEGRQLVALSAVELLFLAVLGWRLFVILLGPLLYLIFLVPFGAFLTPLLQTITARFVDAGLSVLGISHYMTALTIEISAGTFYVAEACAGLRFLIASIAFGAFFALLNYTSPRRRLVFIAASIAIPVVANGFRALGIVVLGSILGSAEAAAADHIVYGWVFFSLVMLLLVAAGMPFREYTPAPPPRPASPAPTATPPWAALATVALVAIGPALAFALDSRAVPGQLTAMPPLVAPAGCTLLPATPAAAGQATQTMRCGSRTWTITLTILPARTTTAIVNRERANLIGPLDSEEIVVTDVAGQPGWRSIVSQQPTQVTGVGAWVDGKPATGGLAQRLLQARESVLGSRYAPAAMGITAATAVPVSNAVLEEMTTELATIIGAQTGLDQTMATLTTLAP